MSAIATIRTNVQNNWPTGMATDLSITVTDGGILDGWINRIQRQICRSKDFQWMRQEVYRNTSDETQGYALPSAGDTNWIEVNSGTVRLFKNEIGAFIKNSSGYRKQLVRRFKRTIEEDNYYDYMSGYGIPDCYYVDSAYINLFKKPKHSYNNNTAFVLYFLFNGYLADLSDSNTTNFITNNYPEILEDGATALGFRFAQDAERYNEWMGYTTDIFNQMVAADGIAEHSGIEEGLRPAAGQSLGSEDSAKATFIQNTDWYSTL